MLEVEVLDMEDSDAVKRSWRIKAWNGSKQTNKQNKKHLCKIWLMSLKKKKSGVWSACVRFMGII